DPGDVAKRRRNVRLLRQRLLKDVVDRAIEVADAATGGRERADGVVQLVAWPRHRCADALGRGAVLGEQAFRDGSIERDRLAAILDRQQLCAEDRQDAAFLDEGQQIVPELLVVGIAWIRHLRTPDVLAGCVQDRQPAQCDRKRVEVNGPDDPETAARPWARAPMDAQRAYARRGRDRRRSNLGEHRGGAGRGARATCEERRWGTVGATPIAREAAGRRDGSAGRAVRSGVRRAAGGYEHGARDRLLLV